MYVSIQAPSAELSQALVNGLDAGYERENAQPHAYADGGYSLELTRFRGQLTTWFIS